MIFIWNHNSKTIQRLNFIAKMSRIFFEIEGHRIFQFYLERETCVDAGEAVADINIKRKTSSVDSFDNGCQEQLA